MKEEFREIPGYNGYYLISNFGTVQATLRKNKRGHVLQRKMLKVYMNKGELKVSLYRNGSQAVFQISKLIARVFDPDWSVDNFKIQYIDGNPANCRLDNLINNGNPLYTINEVFPNPAIENISIEKSINRETAMLSSNDQIKVSISGGTKNDRERIVDLFLVILDQYEVDVLQKLNSQSHDVNLHLTKIVSLNENKTTTPKTIKNTSTKKEKNSETSIDINTYTKLPKPFDNYSINKKGVVIKNEHFHGRSTINTPLKIKVRIFAGSIFYLLKSSENDRQFTVRAAALMIASHENILHSTICTIRHKDGNRKNLRFENLSWTIKGT